NICVIEKYRDDKVCSAALYDADQGYHYIKRFTFEAMTKHQSFIGDNEESRLCLITSQAFPRVKVWFGGADSFREPIEIDVEMFVGVKSFKARGKRVSNFTVDRIEELEPLRFPEPEPEQPKAGETAEPEEESADETPQSQSDILDELTGQMKLFTDEDTDKDIR
ncbi:MAG: DNA gyrase/topoisomerase IV subunit A, partial [Paludibacteraceae bacterium]|nr:DNA gyrase/topoisomerase IV subunit A [Paludibacteraceae bacterium]